MGIWEEFPAWSEAIPALRRNSATGGKSGNIFHGNSSNPSFSCGFVGSILRELVERWKFPKISRDVGGKSWEFPREFPRKTQGNWGESWEFPGNLVGSGNLGIWDTGGWDCPHLNIPGSFLTLSHIPSSANPKNHPKSNPKTTP